MLQRILISNCYRKSRFCVIVLWFSLLPIVVQVSPVRTPSDLVFNRTYTGVVFSPFVKNREEDGTIPDWKNYTMGDVRYMLNLTSTKFRHITTYSMGAGRVNETWQTGDRQGLTAVGAARISFAYDESRLALAEGVWHSSTTALLNKEMENGLAAAEAANSIFPNTVWGIVLTSLAWMDYYRSWKDAANFLKNNRASAAQIGLLIGIRLDICHQILQRSFPEVGIESLSPSINKDAETTGEALTDIQMIARNADFLICQIFPPANAVGDGIQATVTAIGTQMLEQEARFKAVNPALLVTWETGWPSAGVSRFGSVNTVRNLQAFWKEMDKWAVENKRLVYMDSAFDAPWRTNPKGTKKITDPEGPNGADSHFGWWKLMDNKNIRSIVEKIPEPEEIVSSTLSPILITGAALGILLIVIIILVWRLYKARQVIDRLSEQDIKDFFEGVQKTPGGKGDNDNLGDALHLPYDQSFEIPKDGFTIDELEVLGKGQFGTVYKGKISGSMDIVAFKTPNREQVSATYLKNLLQEIKIMIYIGHHENVVKLIGAHTQKIREGALYIASEFCGLGSLEAHLQTIPRTFTTVGEDGSVVLEENKQLDARYVNDIRKSPGDRYVNAPTKNVIPSLNRWSYEIANGMVYLASKKIVHADLAARNILLTTEGVAKISDFGLSRRLYEYTQYVKASQEPLPWRWMAFESLKNLSFSTQSDVWAYGITLWEIFTLGDLPYPGLSWNVDFVTELERGLRMNIPKYASQETYLEMVKCWSLDPEHRPSFADLRNYFEMRM